MSYDTIRIGNIVRYVGNLREHYYTVGEVLSIDKTHDDKNSYSLKVKDWHKKEYEIRAYENEIWPITLDIDHLNKLNAVKHDGINVFMLDALTLVRPIFTYNEPPARYIDKGFVVIEGNLTINSTEDEFDKLSTPVTSLHTLQNYFQDKLHKTLDKSIFL